MYHVVLNTLKFLKWFLIIHHSLQIDLKITLFSSWMISTIFREKRVSPVVLQNWVQILILPLLAMGCPTSYLASLKLVFLIII